MSIKITPAEQTVMKVLWSKANIGAAEIAAALEGQQDWNIKTIKTLLSRLVEKGALTTQREGRRFLYRPNVEESDYKTREVGQLVDRLFEGRAAPLVAQLVDSRGLSDTDIQELEAIIAELKDE